MSYEAIFPNLPNIPWGLIAICIGVGFFVARKFPTILPDLFKPKPPAPPALTAEDVAKIAAKAAADAVKEAMTKVTVTQG